MGWKHNSDLSYGRADEIVPDTYALGTILARSDMDPSWCGFVVLFYRTPCGEIVSNQIGFVDEDTLEDAQRVYEDYFLPLVEEDPKKAMLGGAFQ